MTPTRPEFLHISPPERVLFYILVFASLAVMALQVWQRYRLWMTGKPLKSSTAREGRVEWTRNIASYVILQRKVRSSRKRSGAPMHLLIFFGFLALFLATTLLAIATYAPLLGLPNFHRGTYYLVYETAFDLLGLLFVFGVAWALWRRLILSQEGAALVARLRSETPPESPMARQLEQNRRYPLSHHRDDFLTLGLLLIIGLTGYLLEGARIAVNPQDWDGSSVVGILVSKTLPGISPLGYKLVWWFHAALVFTFFAAIPRMRLRHIVMAFFSAAGNPERPMGQLAAISMEEVEKTGQIGVAATKDYSRWHLMSLDACMECGRCTEVCPAWTVGKVLNPKQVVQDLRGALSSGLGVAEAVSEEALWQCTTCNACVEACPVLIRHVDLIVDARRHLVAEGRFSGTGANMLRQVASTSNAWGAPASSREDWMKDLAIPLCRNGVEFEYLFWVGCAGATDPGAIKTTKAVAELLTKAGVSFACLGQEEACTGDPARRTGDEFLFQEKAMQNVSVFKRYGVKKVVTACPHCFNTLKNEYGDFEATMEVWHHSQLLADLISQGKLKAASSENGEVTLHDPCYLARVNNESDAPRATLGDKTTLNENPPDSFGISAGVGSKLAEPPQYAKKTLCCGAGGGRMWMEEPANQRPGNKRAEQLLATGAKTVAVACPFCRIMLDASIKQVTSDEIRLLDLAELMQESNR